MTFLKLNQYSMKLTWLNSSYFLKGWDLFFKEEYAIIAALHLIVVLWSFLCCNIFAWLSQWQITALIILVRRILSGGICTSTRRLDGKVVIVTGSNSGIGKETARNLAKRGARIVMACRDMNKADMVADELRKDTGANIVTIKLDLSSLESVRSFVKEFESKYKVLDILINNAGIMMCPYGLTKDGFEMQYGVNYLGHFLLTNLLLSLMKEASEARIINVSSLMHVSAKMDLDDMLYKKGYNSTISYANSKLANILFSRALSQRLKNTNIKAFSVHPGVVQSKLGRNLPFGLDFIYGYLLSVVAKTLKEGIHTTVYCATEAESYPDTYFSDCVIGTCSEDAKDPKLAMKLWGISERLVQIEKN